MRAGSIWLLVAALGCTGCVGPLAKKPSTPPDELAAVRAKLVELQQRLTVNELEIERLRQQLAATSPARGKVVPKPAPAPPPERVATVSVLESEAETVPRIAPVLEASDVEPPAVVPQPVPPRNGAPTPVDSATQAAYDRAYALYGEGQYTEAEAAFARFLAGHPDTDLSDNAAYWIGETRFARRDYSAALGAFRTAVETYPQGNKVPDALLKIGRCLEQLGAAADAQDVYLELARRFPGTAAATSASERLQQLP